MGESTSDEFALRALVERYFNALDQRDMEAIRTCFATDAYASFNGGEITLEGRDAIVGDMEFIKTWPSTIHALASASVDEERGTGVVFAVAFVQTTGDDGEQHMLVRGIRYDDRYVQQDGAWRIQRREHRALWQYDAAIQTPWTRSAG